MGVRRIVTVIGARPQFVKASPVSRKLATNGGIEERLVHTGQHYDPRMSGIFFEELGMRAADHNLGVGSGSHGQMTGRMLAAVEEILLEVKPDCVLVYGDTNSTLAGALAAVKLHIPVAHVEAGLRSYNMRMPEEVNRLLTDQVSSLLFAPTETAFRNLEREGVLPPRVSLVGDVMFDIAKELTPLAKQRSTLRTALRVSPRGYVLATVHRAENTDDPSRLSAIAVALSLVADQVPVILPLHPRTRQALERLGASLGKVLVIEPVGYIDMLALEAEAQLIVTDSGGVQKEAYFQGVPCVTIRDETEWVELVEAGWNTLVPPTSPEEVAGAVLARLGGEVRGRSDLYGDGDASEKIVSRLVDFLQ